MDFVFHLQKLYKSILHPPLKIDKVIYSIEDLNK